MNAAGAILRLAWLAGLLREEIQLLTWAQVDLAGGQLLLPDRAVPLEPELSAWLAELRGARNGASDRVALSDRDGRPLAAQSISRLARTALDAEGLTAVRLIDLRHDFVVRQLAEHDWQYVSRITGLEAAAMNAHFAAYLPEKKVSTRARRAGPAPDRRVRPVEAAAGGAGHPRRGDAVADVAAGPWGGGDRRPEAGPRWTWTESA